jgi:hypothetical protein
MSAFDLAVGIDAATMNQAGAVVYRQLYPKLFTGSQSVTKDGFQFDVSWNVKSTPVFVLRPPDNGHALVRSHLMGYNEPAGVVRAQMLSGYIASLQDNTFQMVLNDVDLTVKGEGTSGTDQVKITIYVQADSSGGKMTLRPLKAVGETSNPSDQWFINNILLPEVMKLGQTLLSGVTLPPLSFANVSLTPPTLIVRQERVIALANLAGKASPAPPFPDAWPESAFFALMSEEAKLTVARTATSSLNGKRLDHSGGVNIGIGTAHYGAAAIINDLRIDLGNPGGTEFRFSASINGNVNASIRIGCTDSGVNYNLKAAPQPSGTIDLSINNKTVHARTGRLSTIVLLISPTGNPIQWLLSALTTPILQAITAVFSPLFTKIFEDIGFDVFSIPSVPIDLDNVHLSVQPDNVHFASFGGLTAIEGAASING